MLLAGGLALILEMGISSGATAWMLSWLDTHLVVYRGMRDAGKWAAVIALVYSQLVGFAVEEGLDWLPRHVPDGHWEPWVEGAAAGLLLALPLYYGNGLLFGAHSGFGDCEWWCVRDGSAVL